MVLDLHAAMYGAFMVLMCVMEGRRAWQTKATLQTVEIRLCFGLLAIASLGVTAAYLGQPTEAMRALCLQTIAWSVIAAVLLLSAFLIPWGREHFKILNDID